MKTILVTGSGGTVGSVVVEHFLRDGARVRALVRDPKTRVADAAQQVAGDLLDEAAMQRAVVGAQCVVHCAAAISSDLTVCERTNREGTRILLQAMESAGCRELVHVSTVSVYDYRAGLDFDEESPTWTEPLDAYGYTKAEGERLVLEAARRGMSATILRPVLVLSMHPQSYWGPLALQRSLASEAPVLPVAEVPWVHVDNLADAILLAAKGPKTGRIYNVIDGIGDSNEYLRAVAKAIGRPAPSLPPGAPRLRYSGARIRNELGYAPADRWSEFLSALSASRAD